MIGRSLSSTTFGIDAKIINIEVDAVPAQLPGLIIVGLPDKTVQEARERITSAIKNSGYDWPRKKIIVNLAPADIPKIGTGFDLAIAIAILASSGQVDFNPNNYIFAGELSLEGELRPVNGALSIAIESKRLNIKNFVLPEINAVEAGLVHDVEIIGAKNLREVVQLLNNEIKITGTKTDFSTLTSNDFIEIDMNTIRGQSMVKRAAEISASGNHNMLLSGTPGSGKTMISKAIASILPDLTFEEAIEITRIYSISNVKESNTGIMTKRPFRNPHHTASTVSIIGGGKIPKPGELSLAHRGILFLDEFTEFSTFTLDALRQPLEDKKVIVSRVSSTLSFPANFMLIASMNPCKCGWKGDTERQCICTPNIIEKYKKKISGPIMDRIDLQIDVPRVSLESLSSKPQSEGIDSKTIKAKVQKCRELQLDRFINTNIISNAEIPQKSIDEFCPLTDDAKTILISAAQKLNLSARSYFRVIRVARTIADLEESDIIQKRHVTEALQYRIND